MVDRAATSDAPQRRGWTEEASKLLSTWGRLAHAAEHAHYQVASRHRRLNVWLGIPTVVLSAIVGTSLFATLSQPDAEIAPGLRALIGGLSVLAAVLAALQTFLRFAESAERHVQAGDWYAAIKRHIDETLAFPDGDRDDPKAVLDSIRKDMNKAGQTYPEIGEEVWHNVAKLYDVDQPGFEAEAKGTRRRHARRR